jgi:hypothetical protein
LPEAYKRARQTNAFTFEKNIYHPLKTKSKLKHSR